MTREVGNWPPEEAVACGRSGPLISSFCANSLLSEDVHWHQVWKSLRAAEDPDWGKRCIRCIYTTLPAVNHPSADCRAQGQTVLEGCAFLAENQTSALSHSVAVHQRTHLFPLKQGFPASLPDDKWSRRLRLQWGKLLGLWLKPHLLCSCKARPLTQTAGQPSQPTVSV